MVNTGNNSSSRKRAALHDPRACSSVSSASDDASLSVDNAQILMTQRENGFNEKTWWMVDINPIGGDDTSSRQGATPLVKRCMRTYGWDEVKSRKVLNAYRQFITLKKESQDWDAKILSPCYLVDQMWHCHILDVVNYCHDMMLLCGRVVGHDPDGALDYEAKQKRDGTTRELLQKKFGSYDEDVWDYSSVQNNDDEKGEEKSSDPVEEETGMEEAGAEIITFRLKDQNGEVTMFTVERTVRMQKVFEAYADRKGVDVGDFRCALDGEPIWGGETPETLDLKHNDQVDAVLVQSGC